MCVVPNSNPSPLYQKDSIPVVTGTSPKFSAGNGADAVWIFAELTPGVPKSVACGPSPNGSVMVVDSEPPLTKKAVPPPAGHGAGSWLHGKWVLSPCK